jgi:hypothetical protein
MTVQIEALNSYFDWRRFLGRFGVVRKSIFTDMLTSFGVSELLIPSDDQTSKRGARAITKLLIYQRIYY